MDGSSALGLPLNVVVYLGGRNDSGLRYYSLLKGEQLLVVQTLPQHTLEIDHVDDDWGSAAISEYDFGLSQIQTMFSELDFARGWAYVSSRPDGSLRVRYRAPEKFISYVEGTTWAPLVEEKDIQVTNWWSAEERMGIWTDKSGRRVEVDLLMAWDYRWENNLTRAMKAYRSLQQSDLTYEVLAHVVTSNNGKTIIRGVMTEPAVGRGVEYRDRAAVHAAVHKLHRIRMTYSALSPIAIMISKDGKVRFTNMTCFHHYREDEEDLFRHHTAILQQELHNLFEVELGGRASIDKDVGFAPTRAWIPKLCVLSTCPSPQKPILLSLSLLISQFACRPQASQLSSVCKSRNSRRATQKQKNSGSDGTSQRSLVVCTTNTDPDSADAIFEEPMSNTRLRCRQELPYSYVNAQSNSKPHSKRVVLAPED